MPLAVFLVFPKCFRLFCPVEPLLLLRIQQRLLQVFHLQHKWPLIALRQNVDQNFSLKGRSSSS